MVMVARLLALLGVAAALGGGGLLRAEERVELRENARTEGATRVIVELKAEGHFRPAGDPKGPEPKPLALKVETRFDFLERTLSIGPDGRARRVVRRVRQAAAAINGEVRTTASAIRPEVALLIAEPREGGVLTFSPGGPLRRSELELVQAVGDPLTLPGILPEKPVAVGDSWPVGDATARALSDYDVLSGNTLKARLESLDDSRAVIQLAGEVRGAVRGGEGTITIQGTCNYDRRGGRISHLDLTRDEVRKPGPVEAGLDVKGTLTVRREPADVPPELDGSSLDALPADNPPYLLLLAYSPPDGRYTMLHDRDWHIFWDDSRLAVLKRLDQGEVIAQCNLSMGPNAGKGRHQDPRQFREDIRRALGTRFVQFLGHGEVEGAATGGYRYRVGVQGREGETDLIWYYYLVASPEGDQVLATFTLASAVSARFADQDVQMIGSFEWSGASGGPPPVDGPGRSPQPAR